MNNDYTLDEYKAYLLTLGIFDDFEVKLQYKIYLAVQSNNLEKVKKAELNYYYNVLYRLQHRYN